MTRFSKARLPHTKTQKNDIGDRLKLFNCTYSLVIICSFKPNDATAFVASIRLALPGSTARGKFVSSLNEMDKNKGGANVLLIVEEYSIATQTTFEYEIAEALASLKVRSIKESE